MDSEPANQTSRPPLTRLPFLQSLNRWLPFLILVLAAGYGLTAALLNAPSAAPDQTDTDSSITFIEAKPATASRINRSRPALSFWVAARAVRSSSWAS